jgi:hypothetical protein
MRGPKPISAKRREALAKFFAPFAHSPARPTLDSPVSLLPIDPPRAQPPRPEGAAPVPTGQKGSDDERETS